jgi:acetyltransferase-like isoleucine patch superfamily enzyme
MAATEKNQTLIEQLRQLPNQEAIPWCEDYERMVSGMLYDAQVPKLSMQRHRARHLCAQHNNYWPTTEEGYETLTEDREKFLRKIFGKVGKEPFIEPGLQVDYGSNVSIGDRFYANFNFILLDCGIITIGDRVMIGPNVSLLSATHETSIQSRRDNVEYAKPITIGDDCWIGGNVTVMPGVTIGKGCTVAAGAVVTKDIPDYSVAMGVPAKVVKKVDPID